MVHTPAAGCCPDQKQQLIRCLRLRSDHRKSASETGSYHRAGSGHALDGRKTVPAGFSVINTASVDIQTLIWKQSEIVVGGSAFQ